MTALRTATRRTALLFRLVPAVLVFAAGCGGAGLSPLSGVVTLDGKAVDGASVVFIPAGGDGRHAHAMTKADGSFTLSTVNDDGVKPGDYKVTVTKYDLSKKADKLPSLLPEKYASDKTTPLTCKIPHPENLPLELKSDGK